VKRVLAVLAAAAPAAAGLFAYHAVSQRDQDYRSAMARGEQALAQGDTLGAVEAFSGAIALKPGSMLAYLRRGETYRRQRTLEAAARDFTTAAALDPGATRPLEELGDVRSDQLRLDEAADAYQRHLKLDDRAARVAYKLAVVRYNAGDNAAALATAELALRLDESLAAAHYVRGLALRDAERQDEAERALRRAVALAPELVAAREELADLLGALGRRPEEIAERQVLAQIKADRLDRQIALGLAHARWAADAREETAVRRRQAEQAVAILRAAVDQAPDSAAARTALGEAWLALADAGGDREALVQAVDALSPVIAGGQAASESLAVYGRALARLGRLDEAERLLQQAASRYPIALEALLEYAEVAERQHQYDDARAALIRYEKIGSDPAGFASRALRIASLSWLLRDGAAADEWVRRGLDRDARNPSMLALRGRLATPSSPDGRR